MYDHFFVKAHDLSRRSEPFATAVVVRAEKPTSSKAGDKAIITRDGVLHGWIGGSCAQPTVIEEALAALAEGTSRLVRITPDPSKAGGDSSEGLKEVAMTCFSGGTLDIFIEPHELQPRLLVVGHLPVAQALVHLGKAMNYHTIQVSSEAGEVGEAGESADEILTDLDALGEWIHRRTFVVVATHGDDEPALEKALAAGAPYIGLVASRKRAAPIFEHLRRQGFEDEALAVIRAPAGLDLGSRRGDEIALSIVAEIVRTLRSEEGLPTTQGGTTEESAKEEGGAGRCDSSPTTATDPICGMSVKVEGAQHTFNHEGTGYYFCCAGCKTRFAEDPERYLGSP